MKEKKENDKLKLQALFNNNSNSKFKIGKKTFSQNMPVSIVRLYKY